MTAILFVAVAVTLQYLSRAREGTGRLPCPSNLRQIGLAMKMYAMDHDGAFPPDFPTLLANEDLAPKVFICPSSKDEVDEPLRTTRPTVKPRYTLGPGHCSYIYCVPPDFRDSTPNVDTILAYEPPSNHDNNGMNVLYADGHVDWVAETGWIISELKAGHNPPATRPAENQPYLSPGRKTD